MMKNLLDDLLPSTELHDAVCEHDVERVRELLANGSDVNARAFFSTTPLMFACGGDIARMRQGMKQVMERTREERTSAPTNSTELLQNLPRFNFQEMLAQLNRKREYDDSLPEDDPTIAELLVQHGADVNAVDEQGHSALMKAVMAGRTETALLLLEAGADMWAQDDDHYTPLMLAAQSRRLEAVKLLLEYGADVEYRTPKGLTTLMVAAEGGRVEIAKLLMQREQDVNTAGVNGQTALMIAALKDHEEMIAFLKGAGANIGFLEAVALGDGERAQTLTTPVPEERGPEWGHAALFWATRQGRADLIQLLHARGVSANATGKHGQSPLLRAVIHNDVNAARTLLDAGADPNGATGPHPRSPLHWAAHQGSMEMVDLLLERGASVTFTDEQGDSPLMGAVMFGRHDIAKRLLEAGADPNGKMTGAMTPLMFATIRGDKPMVELLLKHGADSRHNDIPLATVAKTQHQPEITALLKQAAGTNLHDLAKAGKTEELLAHLDAGADINAIGEHGETLLIAALRGKQTEMARVLIERGCDIHVRAKFGFTALITAASWGNSEITRLLIERGANVNDSVDSGETALLLSALGGKTETAAMLIAAGTNMDVVEAALLGELETVRRMLNNGIDVDTRNACGMTPLMGAAAGGHNDTLTALRIRGADINAVDEKGQTALNYATAYKHLESVRLLIEMGADVNLSGINHEHFRRIKDILGRNNQEESDWGRKQSQQRGHTPFGMAVLHEDRAIASLLLEHGADINASSGFNGSAPLDCAAMLGKADMTRFLLEHGADPNLKDDFGHTALQMAEQSGRNPEVEQILRDAMQAKP